MDKPRQAIILCSILLYDKRKRTIYSAGFKNESQIRDSANRPMQ